MKKSIVVFCLSFSTVLYFTEIVSAQEVHIVKLRETLSGIAHTYHVSVGDLMRYNGLNDKSKLQIGERIKIPSKHDVKAKEKEVVETVKEVKKPVEKEVKKSVVKEDNLPPPARTHIVEQGESLFHLSQISRVPVAKLREWNNLPDYTIKIGQELFISKPTEDEIKALQPAKPATDNTTYKPPVEKVEVKKVDKPVEDTKPVQYKIDKETEPVASVMPSKKVVVAETKDQDEEPKKALTATTVAEVTKPVKQAVPVVASDKGFFAKQFVSSNQEVTGMAGVLKTSSGWLDKKYYVLMNNINPGTIVKITYNNNSVYAKVLEALPEIKEDEGIMLRISNAAVSVLNITDNKFQVIVDY